MGIQDEQRQLEAARAALVSEFSGRLTEDEVAARLADILQEFEGAPIRGFIPVIAQRKARERLRSLSA
ncbi:MAG: hypothetical protein JWM62_2397 [Frankiales bacterium]|jgi:hypothetical protein|nr:hypothetical protein [Frankiales bacterium]